MAHLAKPTEDEAARGLAALGNVSRLRLFRLLVRAGPNGLNVTEIQRHLQSPASTLAHHLATLARAGLVEQERQGREVICTVSYTAVRTLADYLTDECCAGVKPIGGSAENHAFGSHTPDDERILEQ